MKYGHSNAKGERSKIAIVTGCSSGIGFETSLLFARNGIYTYATMRNVSKSEELLAFAKRESLPLKVISLDVTNEDSIEQAIETVTHEQNRIDILVNNAGYSLVGALEMLYMEEIKEEFETNFFGIVKLIQRVLPTMRKEKSGRIVNVSSLAGRIGFPLASAYVSSKFALEGLSESLNYELQEFGIFVMLIEPGVVKTDFLKNLSIGKQVTALQNNSDRTSTTALPYKEMTRKRISSFKPRFEKGSSPNKVADIILEAVTSEKPKSRYLVGEDAFKLMEIRKNTSDEEFSRIVMNSVLEAK